MPSVAGVMQARTHRYVVESGRAILTWHSKHVPMLQYGPLGLPPRVRLNALIPSASTIVARVSPT